MMKFIAYFLSVVPVMCGCSTACVLSGTVETREVDVYSGYTSIEVSNAVNVVWSADAYVATVTADVSVLPYMAVESSGKTLKIYIRESHRFRHGVGKVDVCLPAKEGIGKVKLSGVSSFVSANPLTTAGSFRMDVSGASVFRADIAASGKITANISGASDVMSRVYGPALELSVSGASFAGFSGEVSTMSAGISGASMVSSDSDRITVSDVSCGISGASGLYVNCTSRIKGTLSGASAVHYGACGASSDVSVSGASSVYAD